MNNTDYKPGKLEKYILDMMTKMNADSSTLSFTLQPKYDYDEELEFGIRFELDNDNLHLKYLNLYGFIDVYEMSKIGRSLEIYESDRYANRFDFGDEDYIEEILEAFKECVWCLLMGSEISRL